MYFVFVCRGNMMLEEEDIRCLGRGQISELQSSDK